AVGYDDNAAWEKELSAGPYRLEFFAREWAFLRAWVHSGFWLDPKAPLVLSMGLSPTGERLIHVQLKDGLLKASVSLDPESHLPLSLEVPSGGGVLIVEYSAYEKIGKVQLAHFVRTTLSPGRELHWELFEVTGVDEISRDAFQAPPRTLDTEFDANMDATVEILRSSSKHLYVRPLINGEEVGLFVFDTGAGFTGINPAVAQELGLESFGKNSVTGLGGEETFSTMSKLDTFQLGPITIRDLVVTQSGRSIRRYVDGERVVGVIGWDLLIRSILDFSPREGGLSIFDPATHELPDAQWTALNLHYQVPYARVSFEGDRDGLFMVDTGAAGFTLYFFADVVRRMGFLDEKEEGSTVESQGAGGSFSSTVSLLEWVRLPIGAPYKDVPCVFGLGDDGETDPYSLGLLGGGLLRNYRLVMDYSRYQMAFLPH
ncbi:MAG: putative aspartyl protease, partial [Candidatus Paceibacteria bacterium]